MADRIAAEISIGGPIPRSLVPELCDVIQAEGVGLEWGDRAFHPKTQADLERALCDGYLVLRDDEASNGQFDDLEDWCQEHGLAYDRQTEPKYEYDGELAQFRPGHEVVLVVTNAEGAAVLPAGDVTRATEALERAVRAFRVGPKGTRTSAQARTKFFRAVERATQQLRELLPAYLAALPEVEFTDDEDTSPE